MNAIWISLAVLVVLSGPVALAVAFVSYERQRRLEEAVRRLEQVWAQGRVRLRTEAPGPEPGPVEPSHPEAIETNPTGNRPAGAGPGRAEAIRSQTAGIGPDPTKPPPSQPEPAPAGRSQLRDLESWLGAQWLTGAGIIAILFGTAFFLAQDLGASAWSGIGQIFVGLGVGSVFLVLGRVAVSRSLRFTRLGLVGGGIGLLYLTAYAAHAFYRITPSFVVLPFLFAVAVIGAALALSEDSPFVAGLTLAGALLAPLFLATGADPASTLFPYLLAIGIGTGMIAARRRWSALPLAAFLGTAVLAARWFDLYYTPAYPGDGRGEALAGNGVLWLFYFSLPLWAARRKAFWGAAHAVVTVVNGFAFAWLLQRVLAPDLAFARGLVLAFLALIYGLGARFFRRRGVPEPAPSTILYTAAGLGAAAAAVQFDPEWVGLGWALLGLVLVRAGARFHRPSDRWVGTALLALAAGRTLFIDAPRVFHDIHPFLAVANPDFVLSAGVSACLAVGGVWSRRAVAASSGRNLGDALILAAAVALLARITVESLAWHEARSVFQASGALGLHSLLTVSLLWAIYGGLLVTVGFVARYRPLRILGIALFALLCLKVFGVDLRGLSGGYRIVSFVGVGLLLVVISILYQKERRR